jgi:hypothetical protein
MCIFQYVVTFSNCVFKNETVPSDYSNIRIRVSIPYLQVDVAITIQTCMQKVSISAEIPTISFHDFLSPSRQILGCYRNKATTASF